MRLTREGLGGERGDHPRFGVTLCLISPQAKHEEPKVICTSTRIGLGYHPNGEIQLEKRLAWIYPLILVQNFTLGWEFIISVTSLYFGIIILKGCARQE